MTISPIKATAASAAFALCLAASGATQAKGPHRPTTTTYKANYALTYELGSKRAIGYFTRANGECRVTLMIAEAIDPDVAMPPSAARLTMSMRPGQSAGLGSVESEQITLTCGADAETMQVSYEPPPPAARS